MSAVTFPPYKEALAAPKRCPCGRAAIVTMNDSRTGETVGHFCGPACGLYAARLGFPAVFPAALRVNRKAA